MSDQNVSDADLAALPAAYVTGVAYEALIAFTRARQAELGYTQPQFWLLRNLSVHDIAPDADGRTLPELRHAMRSYLRAEDDLETEAAALIDQGCLTRAPDGRLHITEKGEEARLTIMRHAPAVRARIHEGITDADYVTTVKVLHQLISNTGGTLG